MLFLTCNEKLVSADSFEKSMFPLRGNRIRLVSVVRSRPPEAEDEIRGLLSSLAMVLHQLDEPFVVVGAEGGEHLVVFPDHSCSSFGFVQIHRVVRQRERPQATQLLYDEVESGLLEDREMEVLVAQPHLEEVLHLGRCLDLLAQFLDAVDGFGVDRGQGAERLTLEYRSHEVDLFEFGLVEARDGVSDVGHVLAQAVGRELTQAFPDGETAHIEGFSHRLSPDLLPGQ